MRIPLALAATLALTVALAGCAAAPSAVDASDLEGTWIGSNLGYESGEYQEREIRLVIEDSTGSTFSGEKSWREPGGEWSESEGFSGSVLDGTEFHAVDSDGYIIGTIESSTSIHATYLEAGDDSGAFDLELEKSAP